ncbi:MAG TPA: hypothetical protein DCW29_07860 [Janthinobacterium sp.]|nr:hypothetical protein [Janthinobacterium sp.]
MTILILGVLLFLGMHSIRIVADDWRGAQLARHGDVVDDRARAIIVRRAWYVV